MEAIVAKIPDELHAALNAVALRTRRTRSEIVRDALTQFLAAESKGDASPLAKKFAKYAGVFEGGPRDISTNAAYFDTFGESRK
jgi:plasmid stability protein